MLLGQCFFARGPTLGAAIVGAAFAKWPTLGVARSTSAYPAGNVIASRTALRVPVENCDDSS